MNKYTEAITVRLSVKQMETLEKIANEAQTSKGSIIRQAVNKFSIEYK